jgi:hypothetical protein
MCNHVLGVLRVLCFETVNVAVHLAANPKGLTYVSHTNYETVVVIISQITYLFTDNLEIQ